MKHRIPFIQFLMPGGLQTAQSTEVGDAEFAAWEKVRDCGLRMTVELLSDWQTVSMCIEDPELGDFDCVLAPNGPEVQVKLSEMLLRFNPAKVPAWREEMAA